MDPSQLKARYDTATAAFDPPFAIVDMDAFRANAADLARRAGGKPVRVASKSVRVRALIEEALKTEGFAGVMAFTLPEALWLAGHRTSDDILVAYPTADRAALRRLADDEHAASVVTVMVDCVEHLELLPSDGNPIRVCMDIDAGYRVLGGRIKVGAQRSPIVTPGQARALAEEIVKRPNLRLVGIMGYESQIAGVGDAPAGQPARARLIRAMQQRSRLELAARRGSIVKTVREIADIEFVNGGGTGSVEWTVAERAITEVAAGSGLFQPHLFDHYTSFRGTPAALFALPVVRRPGPHVATCLGGGYLASGPADTLRLPQPFLPPGLKFTSLEGAGEVQSPLTGEAAAWLEIGDRVWFRHTKAGELCERFEAVHLVSGDRVLRTVPTYRGEGRTFL
ncbi:amino acid deaminase/aldolase [Actinocorallia sp. API 0066]|uniref:amino acid deaminase/aldolase n=1 Tax=Actinocorallia sp. API 0066 TaxID=2896846 RepID=UPI001E4CCE38|nr:amino acid deaminase/aldolase [Actinocorallia sp. API 0066]MCD0451403.1 amino acid deaminase/aldolase [Actinocorallia sp. API 0066]